MSLNQREEEEEKKRKKKKKETPKLNKNYIKVRLILQNQYHNHWTKQNINIKLTSHQEHIKYNIRIKQRHKNK